MTPQVMVTWMKKAISCMCRVDDVKNVVGHRISAGAIEKFVLSHGTVVACAVVVGKGDLLKGHVPLTLCVLRKGLHTTEKQVLEEIVKQVRQSTGPVAAFQKVVCVSYSKPDLTKFLGQLCLSLLMANLIW